MAGSLIDNFKFKLFGQSNDAAVPKFRSYISSIDPTTAGTGVLIGGSRDVYKTLLGTVRKRPGLKRRGEADSTEAGIISSFEWQTLGKTRVLSQVGDELQVEFDAGGGIVAWPLLDGLPDTAISYAPWYSEDLARDLLIFVNGQQEINMWSGGLGVVDSAADTTGIIGSIRGPNSNDGPNYGSSSGGWGYVVGDLLTISAGNSDAILQVDSISAATSVQTVTINAAGAGYAVNDLVRLPTVAGDFAVLKITTIGGGGSVTGVQVLASPAGYALATGVVTTALSGGGAGLTVNIPIGGLATTITAWHFVNNGSGYVAAEYVATTGGTGTGATIGIVDVLTGRITLQGTENAQQLGFAGELTSTDNTFVETGGSITINGSITYSYTALGDDGFSFVGVSPSVAGVVSGDVAIASVIVSTSTASGNLFSAVFGELFTNDWVATIGNQLYIGCYNSRLVFESLATNYLNYSIPSLRSPGDPNVYTLDSNSRGATAKGGQKGNAVIFGSQGDTYSIVNTVETVQVADTPAEFAYVENQVIDKQTSSDLSTPISNDFIASVGDTILFVDEGNQLRQFGTLRNLATPVYPILSLDVYNELAAADLTGGALRAIAEESGESIYITAPITGILYIYQIRYEIDRLGNMGAERLWQPPFVVNASRVALIDGVTYIYSNVNPQMYQLWDTGQTYDDSPSDEPIPIEAHAIFAYTSLSDRTMQLYFNRMYFEGYMTRATELYSNNYLDYQGASGIPLITINKPTAPGRKVAKFYEASSTVPSLGSVALGQVPLGQGVASTLTSVLPKFRAIRYAEPVNVFEFALDVFSYQVDDDWELLTVGTNHERVNLRPTAIMA